MSPAPSVSLCLVVLALLLLCPHCLCQNNQTNITTLSSSTGSSQPANNTRPSLLSSSSSAWTNTSWVNGSSSSAGGAPIIVHTKPVITSTRGCDDDACPGCPLTQNCQGGEQLTLVGRDFCENPSAVYLSLHQYSSQRECRRYRLDRGGSTTSAVCTVPPLPNTAWVQPTQIYVVVQCEADDAVTLWPALTYAEPVTPDICADCDDHERRRSQSLWWVGLLLGMIALLLVSSSVAYYCVRRRSAVARSASDLGELVDSVSVPMYAPLVEPHMAAVAQHQPQPSRPILASAPYTAPTSYMPRTPRSQQPHEQITYY